MKTCLLNMHSCTATRCPDIHSMRCKADRFRIYTFISSVKLQCTSRHAVTILLRTAFGYLAYLYSKRVLARADFLYHSTRSLVREFSDVKIRENMLEGYVRACSDNTLIEYLSSC